MGKFNTATYCNSKNDHSVKKNELMLYPTLVRSGVSVQYNATRSENASFEIYDMSGRMIQRTTISLTAGQNNIRLNTLDGIPTGQFVSTLRTSDGIASARFSKL
ncbi:MAG: T9SS type A sorting domain-containing protein [Chitinophagaceae bacterium]|nr:T9SS type A sorting domain-containing protein [Chitinophagaceae bacterium]